MAKRTVTYDHPSDLSQCTVGKYFCVCDCGEAITQCAANNCSCCGDGNGPAPHCERAATNGFDYCETCMPQQLSYAFIGQIRAAINTADMEMVLARNQTPAYARLCATHDFCDAGECMIEAFLELTGIEYDVQNETHIALSDAAWALAKEGGF